MWSGVTGPPSTQAQHHESCQFLALHHAYACLLAVVLLPSNLPQFCYVPLKSYCHREPVSSHLKKNAYKHW